MPFPPPNRARHPPTRLSKKKKTCSFFFSSVVPQDPAAIHVWPLLPSPGAGGADEDGDAASPSRLGPGTRVALTGRVLPAAAGRAGPGSGTVFLYAASDDGRAHRLEVAVPGDTTPPTVRVETVRLGSAGARAGAPAAVCLVAQAPGGDGPPAAPPLLCLGGAAGGVVALPDTAFGSSSTFGAPGPHLIPGEAAVK